MEKIWYTSRSYVGLILGCLLLAFPLFGKVIWESNRTQDFSFDQYNSIFFFVNLPQEIDSLDVIKVLESHTANKNNVISINLENLDDVMKAMEKTHMLFHITLLPTEDKTIRLLQTYVTTPARALYNQQSFSGSPWKQESVLKTSESLEKEVLNVIHHSLNDFFTQYYRTNPSAKNQGKFYVPVIKKSAS